MTDRGPRVAAGPPPQLVLEHELAHGRLRSVLLLYATDRWYLGDFLRHASWLSCLAAVPLRSLDLATHPSYLPLFATDPRLSGLIDVACVGGTDLAPYDLVVVPSTWSPRRFEESIARGVYSWNDGWVYTRHGIVVASGTKSDLNYFAAALHRHGQTALPTATPISLVLSQRDVHDAGRAVREVFSGDHPVVIYNPTASNPLTRGTSIRKEVENVLDDEENAVLLDAVRGRMPGHHVLVASALVAADEQNADRIRALGRTFAADPGVRTIFDIDRPDMTSLRGFSTVLKSDPVVAMVGTSTGTNTHLAAMLDLPSLSVERGADADIVANWSRPDELPMGSFRWRNPALFAGAYNLDWRRKTLEDLGRVADAFVAHTRALTDGVEHVVRDADEAREHGTDFLAALGSAQTRTVLAAALRFAATLRCDIRDWYTDFSDEIAYLSRRPGFQTVTDLADLSQLPSDVLDPESVTVRLLLQNSMLHKVAQLVAGAQPDRQVVPPHVTVFTKIRANAALTGEELRRLGRPRRTRSARDSARTHRPAHGQAMHPARGRGTQGRLAARRIQGRGHGRQGAFDQSRQRVPH